MVAKRSARSERTQAINQARALIVTGPDDLHARFTRHATDDLVAEIAALRRRPGAVVGYHTRIALRELGRRAELPGSPDPLPRCAHRAPGHRARPRPDRPCTTSAPTPPRCSWLPPGTTPGGCAPRPPGRTWAPPPRSPPPPERPSGAALTPPATTAVAPRLVA